MIGSLALARSLLEADLVDELNLMIEPVRASAAATRLFPDDGNARPMRLVSRSLASTGVQVCKSEPTGEALHPGHSDGALRRPRRPAREARLSLGRHRAHVG